MALGEVREGQLSAQSDKSPGGPLGNWQAPGNIGRALILCDHRARSTHMASTASFVLLGG